MPNFKNLQLKIDFTNHAGKNSGPLWVEKEALHPVRLAKPGEVTQRGETAVKDQVAILDANKPDNAPIYCMSLDSFLKTSAPQQTGQQQPTSQPSLWFVEKTPRRAFVVPEDHGAFHLDAPAVWSDHQGWDVQHVSVLKKPDGQDVKGYLVLETSDGPMHDKAATEANLYQVCKP